MNLLSQQGGIQIFMTNWCDTDSCERFLILYDTVNWMALFFSRNRTSHLIRWETALEKDDILDQTVIHLAS